MLDWVWEKYERAKAELIGYLAAFFGLRPRILALRERAARVQKKADATRDPVPIQAARTMRQQIEQLYVDQVAAEQKVLDAKDTIGEIESGKREAGLGALPLAALAGAAAVIVTATALVLSQFKKYDYLNRALTDLEKKILSPSEYREALGQGGGIFQGAGTVLALGAAVFIGYLIFTGRRRRAA